MKNNKILIGLSLLCLILIIVAIVIVVGGKPKGKLATKPTEKPTSVSKDIDTKIEIDEIRADGEKQIPLIINSKEVGKIDVIIEDKIFYVDIKPLIDNNTINGTIGETISLETKYAKISLTDNTVTIIGIEDKEDAHEEDLIPKTIETKKTTINKNDKTYISEEIIKMLGQFIITDKSIAITTEIEKENNSKIIESILFNPEIKDLTDDEVTTIQEYLENNKINFDISVVGNSPVNSNISANEFINTLIDGIVAGNIIYKGKISNSNVLIFNNVSATAIMNSISNSVSSTDNYTNIRLAMNLDEKGNIVKIFADTYTSFDNHDIYTYITLTQK